MRHLSLLPRRDGYVWSRRLANAASAAALTAALAACATLPPTSQRATPLAADALASSQTLAAHDGAWPADGWWRA